MVKIVKQVMRPVTGSSAHRLRTLKGLNQKDFWGRIGMTQSCGSRYETGRDIPLTVQVMLTAVYIDEARSQKLLQDLRDGKVFV